MSILGLPYELVAYIVGHLELADVRNLTASCKTFRFLLHEANITKKILEVSVPNFADFWPSFFADTYHSPKHLTALRPSRLATPKNMPML